MSEVESLFGIRKRGPFGLLFKWSFILFNLVMLFVCLNSGSTGLLPLLLLWFFGALVLGVLTYLSRVNHLEVYLS